MYYKDNNIEIRLGLGIIEFKSITTNIFSFILSKLNEDLIRHETITGKTTYKGISRFFNEPKKQYELTIKNYLQWKKI